MTRFLEFLSGYIVAVFAAAFVIAVFTFPPSDWASAGAGIFWISAAFQIALAGFVPALIGIILARWQNWHSFAYYIAWAILMAIGLTAFASGTLNPAGAISTNNLIALIVAGLIGGSAYWLIAERGNKVETRPRRDEQG